MKKTSFSNLCVVIGLLILCIVVLVAVYAWSPKSIVLLEESFDFLDEKKWKQEVVSECREAGEQFHYVTDGDNNRLTADGMLRVYPNLTELEVRSKRDVPSTCYSCTLSENSTSDCIPSLFSARLQSKRTFNTTRGRVEIRARFCCGDQVKFQIGIIRNQNNSVPDETLESLESLKERNRNNSGELTVLFESLNNTTIIKSPINDSEFHIYEINWDEKKICLNIDNNRVNERIFELYDSQEEYFSNSTAQLDSPPISKPFYILLGVNFGEELLESSRNHSYYKRSLDGRKDSIGVEVDYLRLFEI